MPGSAAMAGRGRDRRAAGNALGWFVGRAKQRNALCLHNRSPAEKRPRKRSGIVRTYESAKAD